MPICVKYYLSQTVLTLSLSIYIILKSYCFDFIIEKVPVLSLFEARNGDFFLFFYQLA